MQDWWSAIWLTWTVAAVAGVVSGFLGTVFGFGAVLVSRAGTRGENLVAAWRCLMLLSLAMPLILHAAAWEATMGKFGWLAPSIFGASQWWVAWIHGVYGVPLVSLSTYWATTAIDRTSVAHAEMDYPFVARWRWVQFPIAWPWIAGSILGVMVIAATEMSVADLFGVRTVADQFYLFYAVDPDSTALVVTTVVPLTIAMALVPLLGSVARRRNTWIINPSSCHRAVAADDQSLTVSLGGISLLASGIVCVLGLPLIGSIVQAGRGPGFVDDASQPAWSMASFFGMFISAPQIFRSEYLWTLVLSLTTASCVTTVAVFSAITLRDRRHGQRIIDGVAILLILIPGPIVGLAIASLFNHLGAMGDIIATRTLVPTVLAVSCRSGVVAYFICRLGVQGISDSVWESSRLNGAMTWRTWNLYRPMLLRIIATAWLAAAIISSGDVAAALPVIPPGVTTVGTRLFGLLHSGARYQEAALACWYVLGIASLCTLIHFAVHLASRVRSVRGASPGSV